MAAKSPRATSKTKKQPVPAEAGTREKLLLLDGHSLAYRAYFALPDTLATKSGQVTNAVYGFTSMLIKLLGEQNTDRIAVSFDAGKPTLRLAAYPEYKAGRRETPDDFRSQLGLLHEVLNVLQIPIFEVTEHEADDVLATLARRACEESLHAILVTADRDFLQMVRPGISVLFNRRGVTDIVMYDEAAVEERFGLPPSKLVDYAALKGDTSDNLPGVPGVGEKTASSLIQQFGSVEELFEHLDQTKPKIRSALEAAHDQVLLNKKLSRLVDDLDIDVDPTEITMGTWDMKEIHKLFTSLEFRSLYERLEGIRRSPVEAASEFVSRAAPAADIAERAQSQDRAAIALPVSGDGLALAWVDGEATWVADRTEALIALGESDVVAHSGKPVINAIEQAGSKAKLVFDTEVAAYLLDPAIGAYDLQSVVARTLRRDLPTAAQSGDGDQLSLDVGETDVIEETSARAAALPALAAHLESELERLGMLPLMRDVELPLIEVLAGMERTGIGIDVPFLESMSAELGAELDQIETRIYEMAGGPFNLNSPPQLRTVLYERLGLAPARKTKTGFSTDAATLESLREVHPIAEEILRFRELSKLKGTYLDALPKLIDPADGRLHATFNQVVAATGRISSENPNVQNIPVRTELGRRIRQAFIAGFPGHTLISADYSQIELRVLAHVTGDAGLKEAFARDEDIHAATAAKVYGYDVNEVPKDLRERAKMINYGLSYGMSAFGLASRLGIPADEAAEFIDAYFKGFPGVKEFMERVVREAYKDGYTVTLLGRRRYLPELSHSNPRVRSLGERQALNAPIQGSAADIIKLAMLKADRGLTEAGLRARMVLTVHDELIFEVPIEELDATSDAVRSLMEQAYPLAVPLKVDIADGKSWADAKE